MTKAADRSRNCVAIFDTFPDLCRAFDDFDAVALPSGQIGLAGRASTVTGLKHYLGQGRVKILSADRALFAIAPVGIDVGEEKLLATGGGLWPTLQFFGTRPGEELIAARWIAPHNRDELTTHIINGAVLVSVRAATADLHRKCTQILLQHSSNRVHTHEFNF